PSDLLHTSTQCLIRITPEFCGIVGSVSSLLVMALERFEAFRKLSTYENSKTSRGIYFIALHISLTAIIIIPGILVYHYPTRVAHCSLLAIDGRHVARAITVIISDCK
ncbi:hypothetical protein PMAYCL1PPCAC_15534, partial [Pristionchus mayeri]